MILVVMTKTLDRHAGLLWRFFSNVAENDSVYRERVRRQPKQIDHCLWVAANSTYGYDAETKSACRSHECRHRYSCIADRGQYSFKATLEYQLGAGHLDAQASLVEVYDYRDEHRCLRNPWLATGNFGYACAAVRIAHNYERYLLAVGGGRSTMCAFDDSFKNLFRDWVGLIAAAAVMRLQQADGFIHRGPSLCRPTFVKKPSD